MDIDAIIDEVTKEVLKCISQLEKEPKILILTEEHGKSCHELLEKFSDLGVTCGLQIGEGISLGSIHTVILMGMSNDNLYRLANGSSETRYLKLASEAILTGKRVIVVKEEIELFKYERSAPILYYNKILENLEFLRKCGVIIVAQKDLGLYIDNTNKIPEEVSKEAKIPLKENEQVQKAYAITKKLITDRDIKEALRNGAKVISVMPKTIITQLAKDSMSAYNINLIEQN